MLKIVQSTKILIARVLARLFHLICDPQTEAEVIDKRDYEFFQTQRRRHIESFLAKYLGPRL